MVVIFTLRFGLLRGPKVSGRIAGGGPDAVRLCGSERSGADAGVETRLNSPFDETNRLSSARSVFPV